MSYTPMPYVTGNYGDGSGFRATPTNGGVDGSFRPMGVGGMRTTGVGGSETSVASGHSNASSHSVDSVCPANKEETSAEGAWRKTRLTILSLSGNNTTVSSLCQL